jgi:vesicle coat complex subunit
LIVDLVAKVQEYSEPESKSAIAWIFGEYAEKIKNCYQIFHENFIDNFIEESDNVKL